MVSYTHQRSSLLLFVIPFGSVHLNVSNRLLNALTPSMTSVHDIRNQRRICKSPRVQERFHRKRHVAFGCRHVSPVVVWILCAVEIVPYEKMVVSGNRYRRQRVIELFSCSPLRMVVDVHHYDLSAFNCTDWGHKLKIPLNFANGLNC